MCIWRPRGRQYGCHPAHELVELSFRGPDLGHVPAAFRWTSDVSKEAGRVARAGLDPRAQAVILRGVFDPRGTTGTSEVRALAQSEEAIMVGPVHGRPGKRLLPGPGRCAWRLCRLLDVRARPTSRLVTGSRVHSENGSAQRSSSSQDTDEHPRPGTLQLWISRAISSDLLHIHPR